MRSQGDPRRCKSSGHLLVASSLLVALMGADGTRAIAQNSVTGKWDWVNASMWDSVSGTPAKLVKGGGTHMALLRGNADTSWVLHWHLDSTARLWRPTTPTDSVGVRVEVRWDSTKIFCSGHATLADGKLLVVGGALSGEIGEKNCATFDAKNYTAAGKGWRRVRQNAQGHWYPTATTRGDGKVVALAGWEWKNLVLAGGAVGSSEAPVNEMRMLNLTDTTHWNKNPIHADAPKPRALHSHSAIYWNGFNVVFGGDVGTPPTRSASDTLWRLWGADIDAGRRWEWSRPLFKSSSPKPSARSRHTAVIVRDTMIVFGGQAADNSALNDLWWVQLKSNDSLEWHQETISGALPAPRYGHTAVLAGEDWEQPKVLVYGGRNGGGYVGDSLWALTIPRNISGGQSQFSWSALTTSSLPRKREGHSAIIHPVGDNYRMIVFGGLKDTIPPLMNDAYKFDQPESGSGSWTVQYTDGTPPSPRMRHAAVYDKEWNRMIVHWGDSTTTSGDPASNTMWGLPLEYGPGENPDWTLMSPDTTAPDARWGHTLIYDVRGYDARLAEVFDPIETASIGIWEKHDVQPKWLPPYPFIFNLSDGNLFFAGNGPEFADKDTSWFYSVSSKTWSGPKKSGALGGSAVMWPALNDSDRIMKCGGDDDVTDQDEVKTRILPIGATDWIAGPNLAESRTYHNLTHLPDGKVLLTGGRERSDDKSGFTKIPRMFDPTSRQWGSDLAPDPGDRGYHSSALLLPDARVLCAGGPGRGSGNWRATIFSPPYLYNYNTSDLATRPTFTTYPAHTIHYNEPLYFDMGSLGGTPNDSMLILSLVRAGAPTHGFDQNQRYHKLTLAPQYGYLRAILTGNTNLLPPGDYMLFAVKKGPIPVPSVAKWVKVASETDPTDPGAVYDLDYGPNSSDYYLAWTATGDDAYGPGACMSYQVRHSTAPITDQNWNSAAVITSNVSRPSGDGHVLLFEGCSDGYWAVKTADEAGRWSSVSNNASWDCSGGGLAATRARPGSMSATQVGSDESGSGRERVVMLPGAGGRRIAASLVNAGPDSIRVDGLQLFGAFAQGDTCALAVDGVLAMGMRHAPGQVLSSRAGNVTSAFTGGGYVGAAGETLVVRGGSGPAHLWLETASADSTNSPSATGIAVEVVGPEGWRRVAVRYPRPGEDALLVPNVFADSVRLVLLGGYRLKSVNAVEPASGTPATHDVSSSFEHSRLGAVAAGSDVVLRAGEQATVTVADPSALSSSSRLFVRIKTSAPPAPSSMAARAAGPALPAAFMLSQNEPNPFGEGTLIRFALPVRSPVRLEVFDLLGRRVKILTRSEWPAGYHTLNWDGRDAQGRRVSPGVYLYRMETGSFRSSRKLVVSP
jgi:Domain of unknown function (DUF1929)/FlgD Ig-like domain/Kelch motif